MLATLMAGWHLNSANTAYSLPNMASKGRIGQVSWRGINDPPCGGLGLEQDHYKRRRFLVNRDRNPFIFVRINIYLCNPSSVKGSLAIPRKDKFNFLSLINLIKPNLAAFIFLFDTIYHLGVEVLVRIPISTNWL